MTGMQIVHRPSGMKMGFGSIKGLQLVSPPEYYVDHGSSAEEVRNDLSAYRWILDADLPAHLTTGDHSYGITFAGNEYLIELDTRMAGQEEYSTLPLNKLPKFTHVRIIGPALDELGLLAGSPNPEWKDERPSRRLLRQVVERLLIASELAGRIVRLEGEVGISYTVTYIGIQTNRREGVAQYYYDRAVDLGEFCTDPPLSRDLARNLFNQAMEVGERFARRMAEVSPEITFPETVFELIHEFVVYARQHPKALRDLDEPDIRDLFIVPAKMVFKGRAEGEAFHYDGKLDFKITNPKAQYEMVTGEFKWWRKNESIISVLDQATGKHATGQEAAIHILVLSRNKNQRELADKIWTRVASSNMVVEERVLLPRGSKELVAKYRYKLKGEVVPLYIWIVQLYFPQ